MIRESGFSAIGARLEARLHAHDVRLKAAETANKAENISDPLAALFVLPGTTTYAPTEIGSDDVDATRTPVITADHGVGATFRRKGMLSDIPMPVTRVDAGAVFTIFVDAAGTEEMAFDPKQIELVTKAPVAPVPGDVEFFPNLIDLVKTVSPLPGLPSVEAAVVSSPMPSVAEAVGTRDVPRETAAAAASPAASAAATADRVLPPSAVVLPDGTIIANLVPNVMPVVPPEFSIGATVRRKGVLSDPPMTVTVDYNGIIRATVTDSAGTRTFESPWNQFEVVTRAPGS